MPQRGNSSGAKSRTAKSQTKTSNRGAEYGTTAEAAAHFEVDVRTILGWIQAGCPVARKGRPGVSHVMDYGAVSEWLRSQNRNGTQGRPSDQPEDRAQAETRYAIVRAERAEFEFAILRDEYLDAEDVKAENVEKVRALRKRLEAVHRKLDRAAPRFGLTDDQRAKVVGLVDDEIRAALNHFAEGGE